MHGRFVVAALGLSMVLCGGAQAKKKKAAPRPRPAASAPAPTAPLEPARGSSRGSALLRSSSASAPAVAARPPAGRDVVQRESKIEFDERLVQGQTASGVIYLFQRGESEFRSMVQVPDSFRERTVSKLLPRQP